MKKQNKQPIKKQTQVIKQKKSDAIEQTGVIVENCGNTNFKVMLDVNQDMILKGTISGRMRMHYIKVNVGDSVMVEISPYDLNHCRITKRLTGRL